MKSIEKREAIAQALQARMVTLKEIRELLAQIDATQAAVLFEAMEAVTNADAKIADVEWLHVAEDAILANSNSVKREASRIVGNIAHRFPDELGTAIGRLLVNSSDPGTVVRWSSAYALAKIIVLPRHATSDLFERLTEIANDEANNGVKNQYLKALKKAAALRK